mmetsp:Transcript_46314/g.86830  ORF Transcript_46314/g.86830 Transcript_46314/m.86830 type:complete len:238 (+) Transcript_46314:2102-2815(+)
MLGQSLPRLTSSQSLPVFPQRLALLFHQPPQLPLPSSMQRALQQRPSMQPTYAPQLLFRLLRPLLQLCLQPTAGWRSHSCAHQILPQLAEFRRLPSSPRSSEGLRSLALFSLPPPFPGQPCGMLQSRPPPSEMLPPDQPTLHFLSSRLPSRPCQPQRSQLNPCRQLLALPPSSLPPPSQPLLSQPPLCLRPLSPLSLCRLPLLHSHLQPLHIVLPLPLLLPFQATLSRARPSLLSAS